MEVKWFWASVRLLHDTCDFRCVCFFLCSQHGREADSSLEFPAAVKAVNKSFNVDDGLVGANTVEEAISLRRQLQELFQRGGFSLRKWNSSSPAVLEHIPDELKDTQTLCTLPDTDGYTKALGIAWNSVMDHFRLTISKLPPGNNVTKRLGWGIGGSSRRWFVWLTHLSFWTDRMLEK